MTKISLTLSPSFPFCFKLINAVLKRCIATLSNLLAADTEKSNIHYKNAFLSILFDKLACHLGYE